MVENATTIEIETITNALRAASIPPDFTPEESRLILRIYRLVAQGNPVSAHKIGQAAREARLPEASAIELIKQMSERDEDGNVVGFIGLSQNQHAHAFEVDGVALSAWCAWDTLFIPTLLNKRATVTSLDPESKEKVQLTVTPTGVSHVEPEGVTVSIVTPQTSVQGAQAVEDIWMVFCHQVHFFSSRESAEAWRSRSDQQIHLLTTHEAFDLGAKAFSKLRTFA